MHKHLLKTLTAASLLWSFGAFADVSVENTHRLRIENVETAIQQKLYTGGSMAFRSFYLPAQIEVKDVQAKDSLGNDITTTEIEAIANKEKKAIIIIPDVAQGLVVLEDMKIYLRDLGSHLAPFVGKQDVYILPGRVVEGSYIHHCGLIVQQSWQKEFTDWAQTKQGVQLCLKQLESFNFNISDFSTDDIVKDLSLLIKEEGLEKPVLWTLGGQYEIANQAARELNDQLGGLVVDSPYLDATNIENPFAEYLQTVDDLAKESERGWSNDNPPSFYLKEMLEKNNAGEVYNGTISDIGFNEDINRLFPVNGDALNFYMMAKADQPQFLNDLAQGNSRNIYNQFGAFSLENYSSINYLPESYRSCYKYAAKQEESTTDNTEGLQASFVREAKRQKAICEALGDSFTNAENTEKISIPTIVIAGRLDPYYSQKLFDDWRTENYENSGLFTYTDGSLGTPECSGKARRDMAGLVQQAINGEGFAENPIANQEITCGWRFQSPEDAESKDGER